MTIEEIRALAPEKIILSPGPGRPEDAGIIIEAAKQLGKSTGSPLSLTGSRPGYDTGVLKDHYCYKGRRDHGSFAYRISNLRTTQNAAFLAALSTKSARAETTDEIAGCAAAMRDHAVKVETDMELFEIVGTGGDGAHSFNISTTSALVAAAGGMKVAKHGNLAASSQSGTADCLEALGVNIQQDPEKCIELLEKVGMCFFFAQKYHTSMKYVGAIRKELGFRTVKKAALENLKELL